MKTSFYVYEHWRPDKGECFYVGKGFGKRANAMYGRNQHHKNIQAKLERMGMCVEVRMIANGLTEADAFAFEIERIAIWRTDGAELANLTSGGEGASGCRRSLDLRRRFSEARKGKRKTEEHKRKIGLSNKGKVVSEESRARMSKAQRESKVSIEEKRRSGAALGRSQKGAKRSAETRARMAAAATLSHANNPRSLEVRAKIGAAQKGVKRKPHSPETKAKMSAATKAWRAERRLKRALLAEG